MSEVSPSEQELPAEEPSPSVEAPAVPEEAAPAEPEAPADEEPALSTAHLDALDAVHAAVNDVKVANPAVDMGGVHGALDRLRELLHRL